VLLILLGLWAGLAPFVGPYFSFGYGPARAWQYDAGRLYYSIIPGAAVLVGGLFVVATRSRAAGVLGGLLAALGGAWLVVGSGVMRVVVKSHATIGGPILTGSLLSGSPQLKAYLESLALFTGLGLITLFVAAVAIGRFTLLAAKDVAAYDAADGYYDSVPASQPDLSAADQFQTSPDLYRTAGGPVTSAGPPPAAPPFADAPSPFQDTTTNQYQPPPFT
jgi:hypothetical protein